ncbi:MAG TPA: site-specific integrase, partial [Tepidiformaceae bacterium]
LASSPRTERKEIEPLTPEEASRLIEGMRADRFEVLYLAALSTGLRQGELLGLRWSDIDLEAGRLSVRQARQRVKNAPQFAEPKTQRSRRTIALPRATARALQAHRVSQLQGRLVQGAKWEDNDLVFCTALGRPLDASNVTHGFQRLLARLDIRRVRFHDLRHTCATFLLSQGVDLRTIMEVLGHSQIGLTANTYSHVMDRLKGDAADKMDLMLAANSGAGERVPARVAVNVAVNAVDSAFPRP